MFERNRYLNSKMSTGYQNYVETMENQLKQLYAISESARSKRA